MKRKELLAEFYGFLISRGVYYYFDDVKSTPHEQVLIINAALGKALLKIRDIKEFKKFLNRYDNIFKNNFYLYLTTFIYETFTNTPEFNVFMSINYPRNRWYPSSKKIGIVYDYFVINNIDHEKLTRADVLNIIRKEKIIGIL